jgi:hypothetical protein
VFIISECSGKLNKGSAKSRGRSKFIFRQRRVRGLPQMNLIVNLWIFMQVLEFINRR